MYAEPDFGTLLQRGDRECPQGFVTVAEVVRIEPPAVSHPPVEVTGPMSSYAALPGFPVPQWRRWRAGGLIQMGPLVLLINYMPSDGGHDAATGLIADVLAGRARWWRLVFPDGLIWQFAALVVDFQPRPADARDTQALAATVTLQPTGAPSLVCTGG